MLKTIKSDNVFNRTACFYFPEGVTRLSFVDYETVHEWMAEVNLFIFFAALGLIALSIYLEKKKKWVWHGNSMMIVMIITVLLLIAHMGPSFVSSVSEAINNADLVASVGVIHGIIGAIGLIFGVWLVWVWSINESSNTRFCAPRKKLMLKILAIWILSLGLGGLYYLLHITFG